MKYTKGHGDSICLGKKIMIFEIIKWAGNTTPIQKDQCVKYMWTNNLDLVS